MPSLGGGEVEVERQALQGHDAVIEAVEHDDRKGEDADPHEQPIHCAHPLEVPALNRARPERRGRK